MFFFGSKTSVYGTCFCFAAVTMGLFYGSVFPGTHRTYRSEPQKSDSGQLGGWESHFPRDSGRWRPKRVQNASKHFRLTRFSTCVYMYPPTPGIRECLGGAAPEGLLRGRFFATASAAWGKSEEKRSPAPKTSNWTQ